MKNYYKITPEGTRDYLFEECTAINKVSRIITDVFRSKGYHEALTPGLEFFDAFTRGSSGIQQEDMYKLSDNKGRLLVLRPDLTVPIARMAATRLQKETRPIRLYYNQTVYRGQRYRAGGNPPVNRIEKLFRARHDSGRPGADEHGRGYPAPSASVWRRGNIV